MDDFEILMERREEAAGAYVRGDAAPLGAITARRAPATFFGPMGGRVEGADEVSSRYRRDAGLFGPEGKTHFEILNAASSGDVAFWTGIQRAVVRVGDSTEVVPMDLRVTEVFRREDGAWKLVHRHADTLVSAPSQK